MEKLFDSLAKNKIFKNEDCLNERYIPNIIHHREKQIEDIVFFIKPTFSGSKGNNLILYGLSGTGKTLIIKYIKKNFEKLSIKKDLPMKIIYLNCKIADTQYKVMINICTQLGGTIKSGNNSYFIHQSILKSISEYKNVIIIFDELDYLIKKSGDNILYVFSRMDTELEKTYVDIIGITNKIRLSESFDASVKSSLCEKSIFFEPYNALQLKDILSNRIKKAFYDGVVEDGIIRKCAAISAQSGDARRPLDLLKTAGRIVDKEERTKITENDLNKADIILEKNKLITLISQLSKQSKLVFYSIIYKLFKSNTSVKIKTGDIYSYYIKLCKNLGIKPLSQPNVSNIISELDILGLITSKTYSRGRYGKKREINIYLDKKIIDYIWKYLEKILF